MLYSLGSKNIIIIIIIKKVKRYINNIVIKRIKAFFNKKLYLKRGII